MILPTAGAAAVVAMAAAALWASPPLPAAAEVRESITFLLGEDESRLEPTFAMAATYYGQEPGEKTTYLVTDLRSLRDVRDYLESHQPTNGRPWGVVNLVVHGNGWAVMSVPVVPGGRITTLRNLDDAIREHALRPLDARVIDDKSEIRVLGCGVGRNPALLHLVARAFGGRHRQRPMVRSSPFFTGFQRHVQGRVERCLLDGWSLYLKPGELPAIPELVARFERSFPRAGVDWADALTRSQPRFPGDASLHELRCDVRWTTVYGSRTPPPRVTSRVQVADWLRCATGLRDYLASLGLRWEQLHWEMRSEDFVVAGNSALPAVTAWGIGRVVQVTRVLVEPIPGDPGRLRPVQPVWEDARYYLTVK